MKKLVLIFALFGITFSCSFLKSAEFTTEAGEAAQKALTEEEKEEQAFQKKLAQQKKAAKEEMNKHAQKQASALLQRATTRAKKASEELRTAVSKIGSGQIEQESVEHVQSIVRPTSKEQSIGYLARLPAEKMEELAYQLVDPTRPAESLQEITSLLELRDDTIGTLNDPHFMFPVFEKLFSKQRADAPLSLDKYAGVLNIINLVTTAEAQIFYEWFAQKAKANKFIRYHLINELAKYIDYRTAKNKYHFSSEDAIKELHFLDKMLELKVFLPDQIAMDDSNGRRVTAYYLAKTKGDVELANLFLYYGADPNKSVLSMEELQRIEEYVGTRY